MKKIDLKRLFLLFFFFSILLLWVQGVIAQTSVTAQTATLTNNFDSYNPNAAGNVPSTINSTNVLTGMTGGGWTASSSGTATYNGQGTGTSTTGGYWGYGSAGNFSLGALRSGTPGSITYTLTFTNNTGSPITQATLSWDYKQFRYANTSGWNCTGSGFGTTADATISGKDFAGVATGTNGTPTTTSITSFTLNNLAIANGATFSISWVTDDQTGADNGVSIDNFSIQTKAGAYLSMGGTPTDNGSSCIGTAANPITYTVTNIGLATATGLNVTSNNPQFVVSSLSSTSLAPGATATYMVTFTPTSAGVQSATITATSTASDCNSPTLALTGTGLALPTPTISGATSVCVDGNITLTGASPTGGEWSSGTPSVASIDASTGVVLGLAAGTSVMTYTVTVTGCVGTTTSTVTVNPLPTLTITNPPAVCSPTTVDITTASVQTTNTGTTTKYYNSYSLALAGGVSNVSTPAAINSSGIYYIRTELATGCYAIQPVTVTIHTSPSFSPVTVQPTCLTNGSISFPALTGGTYTYSYTINGGSAISISPSGGSITISVPMGMQTASTYAITATRTDVTPNCPTTKTATIAAIPYCVTPTAQVADPCTCNNDQTTDGSQTGTFNETIAVNGSGTNQIWTVTSVAPLVAGTAPTLAANTVLSAINNSGANGLDDDGDGSTDEPDEAYMYAVSFVHTDDAGYTATIEGPAAPGTAGNQILNVSNRCQYPEIIFGANPSPTYCVTATMPSIALSITEANGMAGTTAFSGSGVSGTTFTPTGGGTYAITATFTSTPGTGKGGTALAPATPDNSCITKETKTTTVTDSRCTAFPH